ncbi:hypothetical protein QBC45DRAFT_413385 [Copromyces sp. CBS 386.78]|nr:hypothetical protein QBC45DRAFT_413385 [Copromyces sp. CBS 386.78]
MTSPADPHTRTWSHINGPSQDVLDRYAITELCKGWPVYRDASEWKNYRSLFTDDACVWTTWSSALPVDKFIEVSKEGKKNGVFIMHRECGTLAELGDSRTRAIGKMKATITHRFTEGGVAYDVDCDCRFIFFCEKQAATQEWKAKYVKLFYEKDKVVPVDGQTVPKWDKSELSTYPEGYRHLAMAQAKLGYKIDMNLPTPHDDGLWKRMYGEIENWLEDREVDLHWALN